MGIETFVLECSEDQAVKVVQLEEHLQKAPKYSAICVVHCETTSGVINPVASLGRAIREHQPEANFFVDAMSSFGAIHLDLECVDFAVSSANKCLQGVPGFAFVIARTKRLIACKGMWI
jgi:2-aminoethylphosphonate-pyruvate transaminase